MTKGRYMYERKRERGKEGRGGEGRGKGGLRNKGKRRKREIKWRKGVKRGIGFGRKEERDGR